MYPRELQQTLNRRAHEYSQRFLTKVREVLNQPKYKATGNLASSIKARVYEATDTATPTIEIIFPEYGYILSARSATYTRLAPADKLLATVKSPKFKIKSVPGYAHGAPNLSQEQIAERVAFAIARSKYQGARKRRYRWQREALPGLLQHLNEDLAMDWTGVVEDILAKSLTT